MLPTPEQPRNWQFAPRSWRRQVAHRRAPWLDPEVDGDGQRHGHVRVLSR